MRVAPLPLLLLVALPTLALAQPQHVRVVWHTEPSTDATISWSTSRSVESRLLWGTAATGAQAFANEVVPANTGVFEGSDGVFFHHASLGDLEPWSTIHFRVEDDTGATRPLYFRTGPDDDRSFALLYGGDSRSDSAARRGMNQRMRDIATANDDVIALVHGGDYIYDGSSWPQWDQWLIDWQEVVTDDGRILPIVPARGNHEGDGTLYNQVFGFPGDPTVDGDWFATPFGSDFLLLNLDSNVSQAGVQREWLADQLAIGQSYRWLAANYHRPAYPAVKGPGGALYHWVPLFEQYNVDFVLESDGHVLKRTVPIRNNKPNPTGVVYLGEGGLGVPQRTPQSDRWYLQPPGMSASAHHVQLLQVTPEKVRYSAIGIDGDVLDTYEFEPRRTGKSQEAENRIEELEVGPPPEPADEFTTWFKTMTLTDKLTVAGVVLIALLVLGGLTWARRRRD